MEAALRLYEDGDVGREEYLRRREQNEREIAHWESRTTETHKMALELTLCLKAVNKVHQLWQMNDDEDRQGMVRSLFTDIIYDLDSQQIVDFHLKPWADRVVTLHAALFDDRTDEGTKNPRMNFKRRVRL